MVINSSVFCCTLTGKSIKPGGSERDSLPLSTPNLHPDWKKIQTDCSLIFCFTLGALLSFTAMILEALYKYNDFANVYEGMIKSTFSGSEN